MRSVLEFDAVNTAAGSENKIHDAQTAARYGVPSAAVPATALLPHHFAAAAEACGFGKRSNASAAVRFLAPVPDRERVRIVQRTGKRCVLDLVDSRDQVVASGTFSTDGSSYGRRCESFHPASAQPPALTTEGLLADERLTPLMVECSDDAVTRYLHGVGLEGDSPGANVAFLVSQFVPFLQHNFTREQPSLYVGVDLLIVEPPSLGTSLAMHGRVDRLFRRTGRSYAVFETAWFIQQGPGQLWARHTMVYDIGRATGGSNQWP